MSDNPFINPPNDPVPEPHPPEAIRGATVAAKPGWVTLICVLSLILGLMGIMGSILVLLGPMVSNAILEAVGEQGATEDQLAAREGLKALADKQFIPNLLLGLVNLVVASMLLVGGIGGLTRKPWTTRLLNKAYVLAIVFVLLRTTYGLFVQISTKDQTMEFSIQNAGPQAMAMRPFMETMVWVGILFGIAYSLTLIIFYALALLRMKSPEVTHYYEQ